MGRVARYKKIKACDPFSKANKGKAVGGEAIWGLGDDGRKAKKRSRTSEKLRAQRKKKHKLDKYVDRAFDAPPEDGDDFDITDLVGSLKKRVDAPVENEIIRVAVPSQTAKTLNPIIATTDIEEDKSTNRLLQLEKQIQKKGETQKPQGRMEGESKNAYRRRVANETRQIIKREKMEQQNPEKRKRKKDFLNNKKKGKKARLEAAAFDDSEDEVPETSESTLVTGEQAYRQRALETQVHFGEQAERPPSFPQLPRKATAKPTPTMKVGSAKGMDEAEIAAEQAEMELMRRKVKAQYALIRAKRHHAGDFHL